jgi:hypothetical protein
LPRSVVALRARSLLFTINAQIDRLVKVALEANEFPLSCNQVTARTIEAILPAERSSTMRNP